MDRCLFRCNLLVSTAIASAEPQDTLINRASLGVREIRDIEALDDLRETWTSLLSKTPAATFFHSLDWLEVYWKHFGDGRQLRVLVVTADNRPVGILPLVVRPEPTRVGSIRVLTYPLDDWGSFYGPIGPEPLVTLRAGLDHIRETPKDWDLIDLRHVPPEDVLEGHTSEALRAAGFPARRQAWIQTALVSLDHETFETYWASRKKKWQANVRRSRRRLAELGTVSHIHYRPKGETYGDSDPRWDLYDACVETAEKSWQGDSTSGTTLSHAPVRDFFRDMHAAATRIGSADINLLQVDGRTAAFAFNVHYRANVTGFRMGFDPAFAKYGPGTLLLAELFEQAFAYGDRVYDFGHGAFDAKRPWLTSIINTYRYTHFPLTSPRALVLRCKRWFCEHFRDEDAIIAERLR